MGVWIRTVGFDRQEYLCYIEETMLSMEAAPNPQDPNLVHVLHELAALMSTFRAYGVEVHVFDSPYLMLEDSSEPTRTAKRLLSADRQSKFFVSDGRLVGAMKLDVPKRFDTDAYEPMETYRLSCILNVAEDHSVTITVDNERQGIAITDVASFHWQPLTKADIVTMLDVFHSALQEAKPIAE